MRIVGNDARERAVALAEVVRVARIERLGLVEFGMALGRGVGLDAMDPCQPWLAGGQRLGRSGVGWAQLIM